MARNTVHGGATDMAADREEARRNLASQGNDDPSADQLDAELQAITNRRAASAHLEQGDGTSVTPESQAAKMAATGAQFADADATPDVNSSGAGDDGGDPDAFDPGDWTVAEVQEYLDGLADDDAGDAERDRVLAAERAGKGRTTITG